LIYLKFILIYIDIYLSTYIHLYKYRCKCAKGYTGGDCSQRICPSGLAWSDQAIATDIAHQPIECSNRGICNHHNGKCQCMNGFTGKACERLECPNNCNQNGICYTMKDLSSKTRNIYSEQYSYTNVWDAEKIQGCYCDYPYTGYDCSLHLCPSGDDPLTLNQVNEIQLIKCTSTIGTFILYYNGFPSLSIPYNANANMITKALLAIPLITNIKVTFSQIHGTACQIKPNIISIEFISQFGIQYPLISYPDSNFINSGGVILISADGVTKFIDVSLKQYISVKGTKENLLCSNRGICDLTQGICECFNTNGDVYDSSNGYGLVGTRGDCGYVLSSTSLLGISTCPGILQCSGHGVCDEKTYQCYCSNGWTGGDCSLMSCPLGMSWFSYPIADNSAHLNYEICSNMGICNMKTGKCQCRDGFYGEACQYLTCGGSENNLCNGHGRCMSMQELALWSLNNGDSTFYEYGSDSNNYFTWDYHRIHGCLCDDGYSGYDCSLKNCPIGDDPGTYNDHDEVQLLQCIANNGNFTLTFRQYTTRILSSNITSIELQQALNELPTITNVNVYFIHDGIPTNGTLNFIKPSQLSSNGHIKWGYVREIHHKPNSLNTTISMEFHPYDIKKPYINTINSKFCMIDGTQIAIIDYDYNHGDLPEIIPDTSFLIDSIHNSGSYPGSGVINVYSDGNSILGLHSIKGTTETDICNNRGLCDTNIGNCQCFPTWTSSNGKRQGDKGSTGDCGNRNDKYTNF